MAPSPRHCRRIPGLFAFMVLLFCPAYPAGQRAYEDEITALADGRNYEEALRVLDAWKTERGEDDAQYWVAGANIWYQIAVTPSLSITPVAPGKYSIRPTEKEIMLTDPATGRDVAKITEGPPKVDPENMKRAIAYLDEGLRRHPHRLDIYTGRTHLYRTLGDLEGEISALTSLARDPRPLDGHFETGPGQVLEEDLAAYQLGMLMNYAREHLQKQNPTDEAAAKAVAGLITREFPRRPHGYNLLAALASIHNDWPETERWLLLASEQDPRDSLVLSNLGYCHEHQGNLPAARARYRRVIELDNNPDLVRKAKARLMELEGQ